MFQQVQTIFKSMIIPTTEDEGGGGVVGGYSGFQVTGMIEGFFWV